MGLSWEYRYPYIIGSQIIILWDYYHGIIIHYYINDYIIWDCHGKIVDYY